VNKIEIPNPAFHCQPNPLSANLSAHQQHLAPIPIDLIMSLEKSLHSPSIEIDFEIKLFMI
jgi:hypothetical protein